MAAKSNNRTCKLLSDILGISSQYTSVEIKKTKFYVNSTSKGEYRNIMLSILDNFDKLLNIDISGSSNDKEQNEKIKKKDSRAICHSKKKSMAKELMAMIQDTEFISSKKDIIEIINSYFEGRIVFRPDNKDSKNDLIEKVINEYMEMDDNQQQQIYSSIRRLYLKNRKSSLSGWSDIITDGEGEK